MCLTNNLETNLKYSIFISMDIVIQNDHMKSRCYFMSAMCGLSLYGWFNYSLFDAINNNFFTPYYQNGLLFLLYLLWDTYHMTLSTNKHILFRKDMLIHHTMSFVITASSINNNALQMSNYMILECISLMNYVWRNNPKYLKIYRTCCICFVRTPLSLWFWSYYTPNIVYPYWKQTLSYNHYLYMKTLYDIALFFVFYDMFILYKLYKPNKHKY
jgi:hypothetical protein